jgi:hypothetical protein
LWDVRVERELAMEPPRPVRNSSRQTEPQAGDVKIVCNLFPFIIITVFVITYPTNE